MPLEVGKAPGIMWTENLGARQLTPPLTPHMAGGRWARGGEHRIGVASSKRCPVHGHFVVNANEPEASRNNRDTDLPRHLGARREFHPSPPVLPRVQIGRDVPTRSRRDKGCPLFDAVRYVRPGPHYAAVGTQALTHAYERCKRGRCEVSASIGTVNCVVTVVSVHEYAVTTAPG